MREVLVEHQAGMPLLRHPRRGQSSEAHECGPGLQAHRAQGPTTYGRTARVAERAFDSADNLQTFAETTRKGITRVLATLRAAPQGRAQAGPQRQRPEAGRAWGPFFDRPTGFRRLASVHATRAACEAVELAYHAAGSVSLFDASPLQRALRDVHAV